MFHEKGRQDDCCFTTCDEKAISPSSWPLHVMKPYWRYTKDNQFSEIGDFIDWLMEIAAINNN